MSTSIQRQSIEALAEAEAGEGPRFVDLRVLLRVKGTRALLIDVGGRWDRRESRYLAPGECTSPVKAITLWVNPGGGQERAARWMARWLRGFIAGKHEPDCERVWSVLLASGRRGGKTTLGTYFLILCAVALDGGRFWAVSPAQEETQEIRDIIEGILPPSWYRWRDDPRFTYYLANGSRLWMRSGHTNLKRGRVDAALINEGQLTPQKAFVQVRGATSDKGGITIVAANPPDAPIGEWINDWYHEAKAGKRRSRLFELPPEENPEIRIESLHDLKEDITDEDTYRREVRGEFLPIGNRVWHAFGPRVNVVEPGAIALDDGAPRAVRRITDEFLRARLGRPFASVVGMDFQLTPHMAAVVRQFYECPWDPLNALDWTEDEVTVEGDENDLADELIGRGIVPADVFGVIDASGFWQDARRTKGGSSAETLRQRGFIHLRKPDRDMEKNPPVSERMKVGNGRLRAVIPDGAGGVAGFRHYSFVAPHCVETAKALAKYELKRGRPDRYSPYAHISDAWSYPLWFFWPRKLRRKSEGKTAPRPLSNRRRELEDGGL
jgi:hypothetical protein